ncbi:MAG TPA: hypothetical protein VK851_01465 [Anaerolineales bacterium]|nr:hypothetical protein [Anaerolineales bacterium]
MSTIASTSPSNGNSLLRLSVISGLIIGVLHLVIQAWIVFILILKLAPSFMVGAQFIASGLLGDAAYTGGFATALLGVILEFVMTIIIAGIFIFSADRIPLLRKNVIVGSLLYGFGVFVVMNFVVLPLSAATVSAPPPMGLLIEMVLEHMLLIGLPLGIIVQRNFNK